MRILFAEDEASLRDFVARGLTESGYAVDAVGDGEEDVAGGLSCSL